MRKVISLLLVLVVCLSFACSVFATEGEDFVASPTEIPGDCDHPHTTLVGEVPPTCTTDGYTGDLICDHCGKVIVPGKVIPKHDHNFEDGVCTECGVDENNAQTGDESFVFLWIAVLLASALGLFAVTVTYRKKFATR